MNQILILAAQNSDLSQLILDHCANSQMYTFDDETILFDRFDAVCILGGTQDKRVTLPARTRTEVEKMMTAGKPVFAEFVTSIGCVYSDNPTVTTHHRMVYSDEYVNFTSLRRGDILDGHCNEVIPYYFVPKSAKPILTYHDYLCGHDHIEMDSEGFRSGKWALWYLNDQTLISSIRISNFNRARLAPRDHWQKIIEGILAFLCGEPIHITLPKPICETKKADAVTDPTDVADSVAKGLSWFKNANMLRNNGRSGVYEGFSHCISAKDGKQQLLTHIRTDCTSETGGAFLLDYLLTGNKESYEIFKNTEAFCFNYMQIKDGEHRGMIRWTEEAWEVCYQDDVARVLLPTLLCQNFGPGSTYFSEAQEALSYLVETTGPDGLRVARTECCTLTEERRAKLKEPGVGMPCAHYNAYYHAVLLLAARAGANPRFADVAVKGLSSIMKLYPNTVRETSETEELCRLVLPLALLYEHTGEKQHYEWLHRVVKDLEKVQHPSGGYAEWDTGYQANCSRNDKGECALLANNGDPVADLLYSNNWLPLGFAYAYMVTKEDVFYEKWKEIATFMLSSQLCSEDPLLHGAWTRALDMNRMESYGVPHDVGWAPCCIETGWTVAEILTGLQFMTVAQKLTQSNQ